MSKKNNGSVIKVSWNGSYCGEPGSNKTSTLNLLDYLSAIIYLWVNFLSYQLNMCVIFTT
ncbi:hypothetical protein M1512_02175 [Patescibacteria group bacterium]|nr:hypothetical protein [Patescibacteria group bacterium]